MAIRNDGYDIYVDQFDYGVNVEFDLCNEDGTPFDLSGYSVQLIVKAKKDAADDTAIADVLLDGDLAFPIDKDLASSPVGTYYYAIRLYKDGLFVNTVVQAKLFIVNNTFESGVSE